jgi:hypothetical protein
MVALRLGSPGARPAALDVEVPVITTSGRSSADLADWVHAFVTTLSAESAYPH